MKTVSLEFAKELIDFAPAGDSGLASIAASQLKGSVAAFNMLIRNRVAYLADEVGLGKTYVALGVLGMFRHLNPAARVLVIAPRENIQLKWIKELRNFTRVNWRVEDNRFKGLDGQPVYDAVPCSSLEEMADVVRTGDRTDPFLRMTSFSLALNSSEAQRRCRNWLLRMAPWIGRSFLQSRDLYGFRDAFGQALNALMPEWDLLIVDEAHNLRRGFEPRGSTRNRILGFALGHPDAQVSVAPWYRPCVRHVLLLSATPFEYDYGDIYRQLDVLGFAGRRVVDAAGEDPQPLERLINPDVGEDEKREIARRMLIRRVAHMQVAGKKYTKNMYRREWRRGGYKDHDEPMALTDTKQRLVVGLIQKKVAEILGDQRFNNSFQIGMLSSFESFLETMRRRKRPPRTNAGDEDAEEDAVFDGADQDATARERRGIDTNMLDQVVQSYRKKFQKSLPHPKMDATASALSDTFDTGEKALIFVRRVATVGELKTRMDAYFDDWIRLKMRKALPDHLHARIDKIFETYGNERTSGQRDNLPPDSAALQANQVEEEHLGQPEPDEGGTDSFFAWFFRGKAQSDILSGAAFQKNRLASIGSAYATFFEDDHVADLLDWPERPVEALASAANLSLDKARRKLRELAYAYFRSRTKQADRYPRYYVFESYQVAGLQLLAHGDGNRAARSRIVLQERYRLPQVQGASPPGGFPQPASVLGAPTFFTELRKRTTLRDQLWPEPSVRDIRESFIERERRRELLSAMSRLGASFIDLYLLAIARLGSFELRGQLGAEEGVGDLIRDYLDLLERQSGQTGFHAFYELSQTAKLFPTILALNFPEVHQDGLSELATCFGRTLQHQVPVGGMSGAVNKRLIRQFRMPGFPLMLATTDVLQEGEDLHLFCRRVIHYGITWTPSAMEQRTGRVDRIGSMAQRCLDGRQDHPSPEDLIQVFMPHLADTVELFQVRRVICRLVKFLTMVHQPDASRERDQSRINVAEEVLRDLDALPHLDGPLESAFPVDGPWCSGAHGVEAVQRPDIARLEEYLAENWSRMVREWNLVETRRNSPRQYSATARLQAGRLTPSAAGAVDTDVAGTAFELRLRSQAAGDATLLHCVSSVDAAMDPQDRRQVDTLFELDCALGMVKFVVRPAAKSGYSLDIEGQYLFHLEYCQPGQIDDLVRSVVECADAVRRGLADGSRALEKIMSSSHVKSRPVPDRIANLLVNCGYRLDGDEIHPRRDTSESFLPLRIRVEGEHVVLSAVIAKSAGLPKHRRQLAWRAWQRNAATDLVSFTFDTRGRLVGMIRHPEQYLDREELLVYLPRLSYECRRFASLLTGRRLHHE